MINMLVDALPTTVDIAGEEYEINTDFRVSILFEMLMQSEASDQEKLLQALLLYFPVVPTDNLEDTINAMIWFYSCGKNVNTSRKGNSDGEEEVVQSHKRLYSFEYDDDYIYAAFRQQYGIDLQDIEYLHWWKFRAMFKSLDEKCEFVKIMGYRGTKITDGMSKREKDFIRKMQRIHALPLPESERELSDAITEALMHGGDVSKLLNGG